MIHVFRQTSLLLLMFLYDACGVTAGRRRERNPARQMPRSNTLICIPLLYSILGGTGGKLRYLKTDISLRVDTKSGAGTLERHARVTQRSRVATGVSKPMKP